MTYQRDPDDLNRPMERLAVEERSSWGGWLSLAVVAALIFGAFIYMMPSDTSAPRVTETTPSMQAPSSNPVPPANADTGPTQSPPSPN